MPNVPDASMATTAARVRATITPDPGKKSRTYTAPTKEGYLTATLQASETQRYASGSVLKVPTWKTPQFNGRFFLM